VKKQLILGEVKADKKPTSFAWNLLFAYFRISFLLYCA